MSSLRLQDRASLCTFTLADGRRCRTPCSGSHPHFCFYHARKESQAYSDRQTQKPPPIIPNSSPKAIRLS
jgi:hypothetical protein